MAIASAGLFVVPATSRGEGSREILSIKWVFVGILVFLPMDVPAGLKFYCF